MAKLVLYLPDGSLHDILLDKERLSIGRHADNDICLPYPAVSGEHATVVTILADSFLEDLNSTNGTLVNGERVAKHFLRDRDLIDIGRHRLVYFSENDTQADPLPPDVLRREILGLHDQVKRVSEERDKARAAETSRTGPADAPSAARDAPSGLDALIPDDELMADFDVGVLPGVPPPPSTPPPVAQPAMPRSSRSSSTVAARLASTWTPEPPQAEPPAKRRVAPREEASAPRRKTTVRTRVVDPRQPPEPEVSSPGYRLRVLTGASEGRELALTRPDVLVGRVGTQVARLACDAAGWRLARQEGEPPELNGAPVSAEGAGLAAGDRLRIADTELVFERP